MTGYTRYKSPGLCCSYEGRWQACSFLQELFEKCLENEAFLQELFEECLENEAGLRPSFEEITESLRKLAQEEAAGQLIYALAAPPEKKGSKLFRLDSKSKKERKQLATITSRPSQVPSLKP